MSRGLLVVVVELLPCLVSWGRDLDSGRYLKLLACFESPLEDVWLWTHVKCGDPVMVGLINVAGADWAPKWIRLMLAAARAQPHRMLANAGLSWCGRPGCTLRCRAGRSGVRTGGKACEVEIRAAGSGLEPQNDVYCRIPVDQELHRRRWRMWGLSFALFEVD